VCNWSDWAETEVVVMKDDDKIEQSNGKTEESHGVPLLFSRVLNKRDCVHSDWVAFY